VILSPLQVPFLPVREEFHPKRNQARQKLATLPASRFEDLSSDVYFELARRYPEFMEDVRYLDCLSKAAK
jgi:protein SPA2